jgi:CheY-like chemotaxis protein
LPLEYEINIFRTIQEALTNVLKHSRAKTASIEIEKKDNFIFIIIEDKGVGFNMYNFYSKNYEDMGMGIAIMREKINTIDGNFAITSEKGKGTTIKVEVPLNSDIMPKLRVLVVEGEEGLRSMTVLELQRYYEVFEVADRDNALTYLEKEKRPDVVLLELFLPPRQDTLDDGFYVLKKFKKVIPEMKIIIVSSVREKEVIDKAKELGADAYVRKPFEIEDLKRSIEEVSKFLPLGKERRRYWRDKSAKGVGVEKRKYWRVSCELPIHWSLIEEEFPLKWISKAINISYGGVLFPVERPISTNSILDMELSLPSHSSGLAIALGAVRWVARFKNEHTYRLGVEFLEMNYTHRKAIADYIHKQ